jgi:hypothetical protein
VHKDKEVRNMKIATSAVHMAAQSVSSQSTAKSLNLQFWVGNRSSAAARRIAGQEPANAEISALAKKLSAEAAAQKRAQAQLMRAQLAQSTYSVSLDNEMSGLTEKDRQVLKILDEFLYRLTGKHIKFRFFNQEALERAKNFEATVRADLTQMQAQPGAGFGLIVDYYETYSESQSMRFAADGVVRTEDGRTIDFSVTLGMSREFQTSAELHVRAGDAKMDPLVINLNGAPRLTQRDFMFDLDCDGEDEQISRLVAGSGFLTLDKNGNGAVNDGGELFGPTLGDGFEELKAYDADGNDWIDENDAVYDKLRIWMADEQGNMRLIALGQAGVGALYLGNVASAFDIKDAANNSLGTVQSTGVFLKEQGGVGTIQHIDLTI